MTIEEAAALRPGTRVMVKRDRQRVRDAKPATVIDRPSPYHAAAPPGFHWVLFDGETGREEFRRYTVHAREIRGVINE